MTMPAETTPPRDTLKQLSVARILRTLDFGVMVNIANVLNREEREAVANYLGVVRPDAPLPQQAYCADRTVHIGASPSPAWKGWGPNLSNTRYTTIERHHARSGRQAETKMGLRVRGRCQRVWRAHGIGQDPVRRQRGWRGAGAEHRYRLRSLGVPGQRASAIRNGRGP